MPSWGARIVIRSIAVFNSSTRPRARSRWAISERCSELPRSTVAVRSAWRFSTSRFRPSKSSRAFSASTRPSSWTGTSAFSWALPGSASSWAICCSSSRLFIRTSTCFCSSFFSASASSAVFWSSSRCSVSVVNPSTGSPFFTSLPSGARNAILNCHSLTAGGPSSPDLTAASSPSTSTSSTRSSRLTVTGSGRPASPPPRVARPSPTTDSAITAISRFRRNNRRSRSEDMDPVALLQSRLHHALERRAGGQAHRRRLARPGELDDRAAVLVAHRRARHDRHVAPLASHHLHADRQAGPHHLGIGPGDRDPDREAGTSPGVGGDRADLLDAALEHAVGPGVEHDPRAHPGSDPSVVRLGEAGVHLHLGQVGDRRHRDSGPHLVPGLQLPVLVAPPVLPHDEDAGARGHHGDRGERPLPALELATGLLLGGDQRGQVGARRDVERLEVEPRLLEGRFLLVE